MLRKSGATITTQGTCITQEVGEPNVPRPVHQGPEELNGPRPASQGVGEPNVPRITPAHLEPHITEADLAAEVDITGAGIMGEGITTKA